MAILLVLFLLITIFYYIRTDKYLIITFSLILIFYLFYMLIHQITYLNSWPYGIAGSDMLKYYQSAQQWYLYDKLPPYSFDNMFFNGAGYIIYIFVLKFLLFYPDLGYINVISVSLVNFLIIYLGVLKLYFANKKNSYLYTLIICNAALYFTSVRILRDPIIIYLIFSIYSSAMSNKKWSDLSFFVYSVFLFLFRNYAAVIILFLFLYKKKMFKTLKTLYILGLALFPLNVVREFLGSLIYENTFPVIPSDLLLSTVKFLLSPDIVDSFIRIVAVPNISTFTYFSLSLWLTYTYLTIMSGLIHNLRDDFYLLNFFAFFFNGLIYGMTYGGNNEPRHKLMILVPMSIMASMSRGLFKEKRKLVDLLNLIAVSFLLFALSII